MRRLERWRYDVGKQPGAGPVDARVAYLRCRVRRDGRRGPLALDVAMNWEAAVIVFVAVAALDWVWARYNIATAQHRVLASGLLSVAIYLLSGIAITQYVGDWRLLLPASLGAMLGTCGSVWTSKGGHQWMLSKLRSWMHAMRRWPAR